MRRILRWLVRLLYGFQAFNEPVLDTPGPVLLLPNHTSWWDWLLIGVCLESDWRFVTSRESAQLSWFHKRIMINRRTFPVDMNSPYSVKHMAEYLQKGGRLVLFPEGRLSRTGSLMKLFDGTGFLIFKTRSKVIIAYLRGAKRLPLSPNPGLKQWFPRLSAHFSPILTPPKYDRASIAVSRSRLTDWLYGQMIQQQFETEMEFGPLTIPTAIEATARWQSNRVMVQDVTMQKISGRRLLTAARLLSKRWSNLPAEERRVGVLLPNVNAMPITLLGLWAANKLPAVLNYSTGPAVLLECARLAGLKQIVSSRVFIERLALDIQPFKAAGIEFVFLEEVRASISTAQKVKAALATFFHAPVIADQPRSEETAVILFTSGSEGTPKGVELTHRNLLANIHQMMAVIDLLETDRFFNALPLFHSFGLTIGLLLPLIEGVFVFLYLSPLHYRVVPSAVYNLNCTVFFGTNTFLTGYARKAHPYDFHALRYLFAGAEKLQESTIALWVQKFGVRVLEGYGATECSPAISANTPMRQRPGSAGQFLPGIEHRLEPVEGIEREEESKGEKEQRRGQRSQIGRLFVRGPNIMRGYLNPEVNAAFEALSGWYDTGDIVKVDADGYVHILGRLKRFAKISGEMVSLSALEDVLASAFPQYGLKFAVAVVAKSDEAKGEKLVAVTNEPKLTLEQVREAIRSRGLTNLAAPREVKVLHNIPRLGSGKVNHRELEKMV
jgi:acyl-[acyl-carrier-protein]-phospholipid O-acyltransferase/long-chain-fatty-acid--[acyl-carrier-protein] ligase